MSRILLIRHGQASIFGKKYDQLSPLGHEQAQALATFWQENKMQIHHIFAGNLERQKDSANIAARFFLKSANLQLIPDFNEHHGSRVLKAHYPSQIHPDASSEEKKAYLTEHLRLYEQVTRAWVKGELETPEGCEAWQIFRQRVKQGLEEVKGKINKGETLAIFTSGGPVAVIVGEVLGLPDEKIIELSWVIKNASITELLYSGARLSLSTFNTTPHLPKKHLNSLV